MTHTWTDDELDAALADLGAVLDGDAGGGSIAGVRARVVAGAEVDLLEVGPAVDLGTRRRLRLAPALLLAAALLVAAVLATVFWPRAGHDAQPLTPSSPSSPTDPTDALFALLPGPLPPVGSGSYTVLASAQGVGDGDVAVSPLATPRDAAGNPIVLFVNVSCGDPAAASGSAPAAPLAVTDDEGPVGQTGCAGIADGRRAGSTVSWSPPSPTGHSGVHVDVSGADVVWKLTVTVTSAPPPS